MPEDNS